MGGIKLYCLPYAGGSAAIYTKWGKYLDSSIELCPIELAGRADRFKEPYYNSMSEAVDDIANLIGNGLEENEYALFGHSMGSMIAYELIYRFRAKNLKSPIHVFFSGRYPPSIKKEKRNVHLLSETEFKQEVTEFGGLPENLFRFKGLLKIALETLRADFKMIETYECDHPVEKFDFDFSVLAGREDVLAVPSDMKEWKKYASKQCTFYYFDGGHFYLHDHTEKIAQIINNTLVHSQP
jgi:medium-chain acyl-[acyl-carrier-protein] hydrolase